MCFRTFPSGACEAPRGQNHHPCSVSFIRFQHPILIEWGSCVQTTMVGRLVPASHVCAGALCLLLRRRRARRVVFAELCWHNATCNTVFALHGVYGGAGGRNGCRRNHFDGRAASQVQATAVQRVAQGGGERDWGLGSSANEHCGPRSVDACRVGRPWDGPRVSKCQRTSGWEAVIPHGK